MNALNKIANDWEGHQAARTNAINGKPWGWQWGGAGLFKQMREILRPEYIRGPVLDIGCGGGKWEKWFIDTFGVEVIGGDVHRTAVDDARAYEPRATYVILDGDSLHEFQDDSVGTVFIFDVLTHLPQVLVARYFQEAHRVASHSLIFSLPDLDTEVGGGMFLNAVHQRAWTKMYEYGYMNYYVLSQAAKLLELAGWEHSKLIGYTGSRGPRDMIIIASKETL